MQTCELKTRRVRVMIVEDSLSIRQFLEFVIGNDSRLEIVSSVSNAEQAIKELPSTSPDVISMDIHLPGMNGLEATQRIMEEQPTPIVIVTGSLSPQTLHTSLNALQAGAVAIVEKPVGASHAEYITLSSRLCTQLAIMSQVRVIRQRLNKRHRFLDEPPVPCFVPTTLRRPTVKMIGIVASTGGPRAVQTVLSNLPAEFPVPVVLVQHIAPSFHNGFVQWLNHTSPLTVVIAGHAQVARPGHVYVAPPECHLEVDGMLLLLRHGDPVAAQRPSGTLLLQSMANTLKQRALGIVLTGMGDDGARGLLSIRQAGGFTIAEDASTAAVYGMPAVAAQLGAVCEPLPLGSISGRVKQLVHESMEVA